MTPMGTNYGETSGEMSNRHMNYYSLRAKGGVGLIILENANIEYPVGSNGTSQIRIDHDSFMPRYYQLVENLHKNGATVAIQINHAGASASSARTGMETVSSSNIPTKAGGETPRPMTKEEIRAVSVAQMELTEDAVVYDIGAGTGSVSVEIALSGEKIKVYAIEKNPEGVELIRQNRKKFRVDGIRIIEGNAPEVLEGLEMPTHVFIGGSSGNLRQIIEKVTTVNPEVKIVLNAISLETLGEVMELSKDDLLKEIQVTQLSAARSRILGDYHMMTGMNPVYIIRSERRSTER